MNSINNSFRKLSKRQRKLDRESEKVLSDAFETAAIAERNEMNVYDLMLRQGISLQQAREMLRQIDEVKKGSQCVIDTVRSVMDESKGVSSQLNALLGKH